MQGHVRFKEEPMFSQLCSMALIAFRVVHKPELLRAVKDASTVA
jgi:hypothetical protein